MMDERGQFDSGVLMPAIGTVAIICILIVDSTAVTWFQMVASWAVALLIYLLMFVLTIPLWGSTQ